MQLNLATRDIFRIFTVLEHVSISIKIRVMSKYFTAAVESALKFNMITVVDAIELGISDEALQTIENDKIKDHKHTYKQIDPDGTAECTKCGLRNSDPSKTGEKVVKENAAYGVLAEVKKLVVATNK